jgi:hypothetical protein
MVENTWLMALHNSTMFDLLQRRCLDCGSAIQGS